MRIDPRHFNKFMAIVAAIAAILIVIATLFYTSGRESAFQQQMMEADTLGSVHFPYIESSDSLRLNKFQGRYLLLDFWSSWSEQSLASHKSLAEMSEPFLNSLTVVAASVRTDSSDVSEYRRTQNYPFEFVDGTEFYHRMNLPGIPCQVLFNPSGEVVATFVGYTDSARYDTLKTYIQHE